jgi:hypothetical protein
MEQKKNKILKYDMSKFLDYFVRFRKLGVDFTLKQDGSIKSLKWGNDEIVFRNYDEIKKKEKGAGFHISKMVKTDVANFIKNNPNYKDGYTLSVKDIYPQMSKANMVGLVKHKGNMIYSVDINDCYWDTAKNLGFISDLTYYKGLQKKEWKMGRNASIGSLGKTLVVSEFIKGEMVSSEVDESAREFSIIRDRVVSHVHDLFLALLRQLGDDWLMYFTDCVYVSYNKIVEVQEYFEKHGYQSKVNSYDLDSVDVEKGFVQWYDFKTNSTPMHLRKEGAVVNKSYYFCKRQTTLDVIPEDLEAPTNKISNNTDFLNS